MLAQMARGTTVLDVGYAQQPNPYLGRFHRVGIDLNAPAPDRTVHYDEELVGDINDIERILPGRRFDTILCGEVIEHVENPYALLRNLKPLLAPQGRLLVSTPNPLAPPVVLAEYLRSKKYFYTADHLHYFLPRWVARIFAVSGYELDAVRPVGLWSPWFTIPWVPVTLSYQVIYAGTPRPR
jgi:SAM-dependent methyltransferase